MSKIFLSHSSADEREAVALKQWLADNGWNDVFLDVDPQRGLAAGERWQEALRRAADRCEAVVFIVSPAWAKSKWCLAEFLLAKSLHKLIFGVVLKDVPIGELPTEMTAEWQLCRLAGEGSSETIRFTYREATDQIGFLAQGLLRLRDGLHKAGLSADFFPWPPKDDPQRAPYRGLEPLEASDAAVFFGRDVEILRGLDALRGMRDAGDKHLFIILGASGAGKSSFLRAGLLPRLARDDRHFYPLAPIRPEHEPLFGERGLAHALHRALAELKLPAINLGDIKAQLRQGPAVLAGLLRQLQDALCARLLGLPEGAPPPTLVLPVDQAEELFNPDASDEARDFLRVIGGALRENGVAPPIIVAFTIRSDRYEPLQTAPELAGIQSVVFDDLKPMPPTRFREVILGPALRASAEGKRLTVEHELVERLVGECTEGGDALPLLGLTLARLFRDYGGDGDLRLDEYRAMGGLEDIVKTEAEFVLSADEAIRKQQLELLHSAFIPWLATINPQNDQPMRRLARRADLPGGAHALIDALAKKRLLLTDRRNGVTVIEVAHEALLRQWDVLTTWLEAEREDLKDADVLERADQAWKKSGRKDAWLMEGERLAIAEALAAKPGFSKRLDDCQEFLLASRRREKAKNDEEERHRRAELEAAQQLADEQKMRAAIEAQARLDAEANAAGLRTGRRKLIWALVSVALAAVVAVGMFSRARTSFLEATVVRIVGYFEDDFAYLLGLQQEPQRRLLSVIAATRIAQELGEAPKELSFKASGRLWKLLNGVKYLRTFPEQPTALAVSPDGKRIVIGIGNALQVVDALTGRDINLTFGSHAAKITGVFLSNDGNRLLTHGRADRSLILWDASSGRRIAPPWKISLGILDPIAFSPDGRFVISGHHSGKLRLWDAGTGAQIGTDWEGDGAGVRSVAFSNDGRYVISGDEKGQLSLWDASKGRHIKAVKGHSGTVTAIAFDPSGTLLASVGTDKQVRLWNPELTPLYEPLTENESFVTSVAFSSDGKRLVAFGLNSHMVEWDVSEKPSVIADQNSFAIVRAVSFIPTTNGDIVTIGEDKTLRVWTKTRLQFDEIDVGSPGKVAAIAVSPNGDGMVFAAGKSLRYWDAAESQFLASPAVHSGNINCVAFSPDGERIVSGSDDGTVLISESRFKEVSHPLRFEQGASVTTCGFKVGSSEVLTGGADGSLRVIGIGTEGTSLSRQFSDAEIRLLSEKDHEFLSSIVADATYPLNASISADGRRIALFYGDRFDELPPLDDDGYNFLVASSNLDDFGVSRFIGHSKWVNVVAFSRNGKTIASASMDHVIRIWSDGNFLSGSVSIGKDRDPWRAYLDQIGGSRSAFSFFHDDVIGAITFSEDGRFLASASHDKSARIWSMPKGELVGLPLDSGGRKLYSVAFDAPAKYLYAGSDDGIVLRWPVLEKWVDALCEKTPYNMSRQQWREWVSPEIEYKCQCPGLPIPSDDPKSNGKPELCPGKPAEPMSPLDRPPT